MNEIKEIKFKPTIFSEEQKLVLDSEYIEFYKSPEIKTQSDFQNLK